MFTLTLRLKLKYNRDGTAKPNSVGHMYKPITNHLLVNHDMD